MRSPGTLGRFALPAPGARCRQDRLGRGGRRRLALVLLLTVAFAAPAASGEEPVGGPSAREAMEARLRSPLAAERLEAERSLLARGAPALSWARLWIESEEPRLRGAGWALLACGGDARDLVRARRAMGDPQPAVAAVAAEAVVSLAARLGPPEEAWVPAGTLQAAAIRPLGQALARRLGEVADASVPPVLSRIGEGAVPALRFLATTARFPPSVRDAAVDALAAIGGDAAREALGALAYDEGVIRREAWWRALVEVGSGKGLAPVHTLVSQWAQAALESSALHRRGEVRGPRGLSWKARTHFYRFLRASPPVDEEGHVEAFLRARLSGCASPRGWDQPSLIVEIVRAYLVVCDPDDDGLRDALAAARGRPGRASRRREELGEILAALEVYRERAVVQKELRVLLRQDDLPQTVRAWAHYLIGDEGAAEAQARALALLHLEGDAATLAQRRLGARLLDRGTAVPMIVLERYAQDLDPWLRTWALSRLVRLRGALPLQLELRTALSDPHEQVFLLAAETLAAEMLSDRAGAAVRARALELAVGGARRTRPLAWRALARWARARAAEEAAPDDASEGAVGRPWAAPPSGAPLDLRIQAAAAFRSRMGD
jgi:hypothetical protein